MEDKNSVLGAIVTYNPNIQRLKENINKLKNQVSNIIIFDNGSKNIKYIENLFPSLFYISSKKNVGIAQALKKIMTFAIHKKYRWVLTLDQDSIVNDELVKNYLKYCLMLKKVGALSCIIKDRNFKDYSNNVSFKKPRPIKFCITAGCFMNVDAYKQTEGYDSKMFIDNVDFDICLALRSSGYKIYQIPYEGVLQEVGKGRNVKLFFKNEIVYNHDSFRKFFISRNNIYLAKKYPNVSMTKALAKNIKILLLVLIFEKEKRNKIASIVKGTIAGFAMNN